MSGFSPSAALLRTSIVRRAARAEDSYFESGAGTKAATRPHERQTAAKAAEQVTKRVRRRVTTEERSREILRRRKWSGGSSMPAELRGYYSEAERAALSVIADRCKQKGFCDLCLDEIARVAGVGRTSVQNALRKARSKELSHISVRERPQRSGKNLTNIIKIVSRAWRDWIVRAIGFKRLNTSVTSVKTKGVEVAETVLSAFEKAGFGLDREPSETTVRSASGNEATWTPWSAYSTPIARPPSAQRGREWAK
ncbi:hypothetical protein ACQQ2Q_14775 [Agrobacterium sp. ES01]|uniref:hypothetical protein n=1 Tax=Agrobacterium sp. ES01 TaxID=3420714 RepID=UPI003D123877